MDSKYPEAAGAELIDYMTLRAAAVANLAQIRTRLNSRLKKRNPAEE
jgi:hypothetical protein